MKQSSPARIFASSPSKQSEASHISFGDESNSQTTIGHGGHYGASQKKRKSVVTVRISESDVRKIGFFPDSPHTTPETLRLVLLSAFGLSPETCFILIDESDGSIVPIDKSLCYLDSIKLVIVERRESIEGEAFDVKETHYMKELLEISASISAQAQPKDAVLTIVRRSKEILAADQVTLFVVDVDSHSLIIAADADDNKRDSEHFGSDADDDEATIGALERLTLDNGAHIATEVVRTGQVISEGKRVCFPVRESEGAILGAIEAARYDDESCEFDDYALRALEYIASCAISVLYRLQLWHHTNRAEERAQALLKVTKTLAAARKPEEIINLVVKEAYALLKAERVAVFLVHAQERELEICLSKDATGKRIPMTAGVAGYVARTGQTVNVPDARKDPRFDSGTDSQTGFRTKSVLCCPIMDSSGRVIGVIQALNKRPMKTGTSVTGRPLDRSTSLSLIPSPIDSPHLDVEETNSSMIEAFSEDDQELLEMLTQSAGVTLQNAQLLQATEHAKVTSRALLRLVQQIVGESDFIKLDHLLRSCCRQLLDCDRCIVAWISRADNTLRIFLDDHQTLSIDVADRESIEASLCRSGMLANCPNRHAVKESPISRFEEKTGYKVESILVAPIAGGMEGPIAYILAMNKLELESSLAHASSSASSSPASSMSRANTPPKKPLMAEEYYLQDVRPKLIEENPGLGQEQIEKLTESMWKTLSKQEKKPYIQKSFGDKAMYEKETGQSSPVKRVSRAYKAFSKEDESDMNLFCSEIEGALRVKRNLQTDFNNLLFGEEEEEESEDAQSIQASTPKVDFQQRRLMMLYSGFNSSQKSLTSLSSNASAIKRKDRGGALEAELSSSKRVPPSPIVVTGNNPHHLLQLHLENRPEGTTTAATSTLDLGTSESEDRIEAESKSLLELKLSDVLNMDVLGQTLETCKNWSLALFFSDMSLLRQCGVDIRKFPRFVSEVNDNYNANPFHNFYHAFAVLHTAHDFVKRTVEGRKLDPLCALSILLGSFCHDLGHKGFTNSYETGTVSELAVRYSDDAVLERFHCHLAFRLLYQDERSNLLATLSKDDFTLVRKFIIEGILATDMRRHAEHVEELERVVVGRRRSLLRRSGSFVLDHDNFLRTPTVRQRSFQENATVPASPKGTHHRRSSSFFSVLNNDSTDATKKSSQVMMMNNGNNNTTGGESYDLFFSKPEGKSLLVRTIVHSADLSSQTLKIEFAEDWGRRITEEFTRQAEVERARKMPVSVPVCNSDVDFYKSQIFFIKQIVLPLWRPVAELIPEMDVRVDALNRNMEHYESCVKRISDSQQTVEATTSNPTKAVTNTSSSQVEASGEQSSSGHAAAAESNAAVDDSTDGEEHSGLERPPSSNLVLDTNAPPVSPSHANEQ